MRIWLLYLFCLLSSVGYSKFDFDSLRLVLLESTERADFYAADSIIKVSSTDYNSIPQKNLIHVASERTKQLSFEYLSGKFILRESIIETLRGDFGSAFKLAKEALKILSKYNSIETTACYNTIAGMVAYLGDTEGAIEYMKKADQICELFKGHPNYNEHRCNNHLMWGNIYLSSGNLVLGEQHILKCLKIAQEEEYTSSEVYARLNLSKLAIEQKDYERSFEHLDVALEISKANKIYNLEAITDIKIAQTYEAQGKINAAILKYHQAEKLAQQQDLGDRLLTIYKSLSRLYKSQGDLNRAFIYQEKYITAFEEQKIKEKQEQLEMLQVKFKMNEKNAMIVNLALDKAHEEAQKNILKFGIFVTISVIVILVLIMLLIYNRNRLRNRLEAERLERAVSSYQLTALKSQMNPHFIFNALNSIQDLILKEQTEESYKYINMFADLVRKTLNHSSKEFIDIDDEFASIQVYLALERLRFKDDITIEFETNSISDVSIPPLLIQPFIENSIKHGLLHKKGEKHLRISFKLKDELLCTISDNGIGRKNSQLIKSRRAQSHPSFATESIAGRFDILQKIYGKHVGITYIDIETDGEANGTTVLLNLPFRQKF